MDASFKNSLALQMKKYNELDTFVAKMHYSGHTVALFQLYIDVIQNNYQSNTQKEILAQTLKDNITIISAEIPIEEVLYKPKTEPSFTTRVAETIIDKPKPRESSTEWQSKHVYTAQTEYKPMLTKYSEGKKPFVSLCPSPKSKSFYEAKSQCKPQDKTKFYNNLVYSEFQHINQPGTFPREDRKMEHEPMSSRSPGPASYENSTRAKSPGGVIAKQKREFLIKEKEAMNTPGPLDYQPKYHFISKLKW